MMDIHYMATDLDGTFSDDHLMSSVMQQQIAPLTLCLLVSSADSIANSLSLDQARQNVGPDLDPNCLTL